MRQIIAIILVVVMPCCATASVTGSALPLPAGAPDVVRPAATDVPYAAIPGKRCPDGVDVLDGQQCGVWMSTEVAAYKAANFAKWQVCCVDNDKKLKQEPSNVSLRTLYIAAGVTLIAGGFIGLAIGSKIYTK